MIDQFAQFMVRGIQPISHDFGMIVFSPVELSPAGIANRATFLRIVMRVIGRLAVLADETILDAVHDGVIGCVQVHHRVQASPQLAQQLLKKSCLEQGAGKAIEQ